MKPHSSIRRLQLHDSILFLLGIGLSMKYILLLDSILNFNFPKILFLTFKISRKITVLYLIEK